MPLLPHLVFLVGVDGRESPGGGECHLLDALRQVPQEEVG